MDIINFLHIIIFMIFAIFLIVLTLYLTRNKNYTMDKVLRRKPSRTYMKTRILVLILEIFMAAIPEWKLKRAQIQNHQSLLNKKSKSRLCWNIKLMTNCHSQFFMRGIWDLMEPKLKITHWMSHAIIHIIIFLWGASASL